MRTFLLLGSAALLCAVSAAAQSPADPAALLAQSCDTCHAQVFGGKSDAVYTRGNRRVNSAKVLVDQVRLWNSAAGAKWSDAHIDAVAAYLNQKHYQLQ